MSSCTNASVSSTPPDVKLSKSCLSTNSFSLVQDDTRLETVANSTTTQIYAVAQYLLDLRPQSQVLLVGLLPRGDLILPPELHLAQPSK